MDVELSGHSAVALRSQSRSSPPQQPNNPTTCLRVNPIQHSRIRNRLSQMRYATDPRHTSFNAHTETGMGERAVLARVEVPLELVEGKAVLLDALEEEIVIVDAL